MRNQRNKRLIGMGTVLWVAVFLVTSLTGCTAAVPSGGEFQKETAPAEKSKESTQSKAKVSGKLAGYEIYENKDPFQPLAGPGATTRTITTTTTTTDTSAGGGTTTTTTTNQTQVRLIAISGTTATIEANGTEYPNLNSGDTFAGSYKLLSIGTGSVVILYGDNQYTLYLGETISVK